MRIFLRLVFFFTAVFILGSPARADGILLSWSMREVPALTEKSFNEAKQWSSEQIAQKNLTVSSWTDAFLLMIAATPRKDEKQLLSSFASQLTNSKKTTLTGTNRLIIWERITSGEILFEGKGYQVDDDLFTVAGRANWVLRGLTKKNFGIVRPSSSSDDLTKLQQKWTRFFDGETVDEYKNIFETTEKGLSEIRSLSALQALIVALKTSEPKDSLTKGCLQKLYKIDKLPSDPSSPASMCSPDTMTHTYLKVITDIVDKHDYDWWKAWWDKNQTKLDWKSEKGKFEVKN